ncbi:hypothetical protein BDY19DRAFT_995620 [Irpex rosettiformis]|uniref:Uncharacterized protein n=1 Tax=Irpex rosettiformis TaxID=378272 RepID=A0ACB8TXS1_9APHY|nr:hypothetical protein BDY19DRAFT_995620 [Irpex rosettiformis]
MQGGSYHDSDGSSEREQAHDDDDEENNDRTVRQADYGSVWIDDNEEEELIDKENRDPNASQRGVEEVRDEAHFKGKERDEAHSKDRE